jgi:hypothetical protein
MLFFELSIIFIGSQAALGGFRVVYCILWVLKLPSAVIVNETNLSAAKIASL